MRNAGVFLCLLMCVDVYRVLFVACCDIMPFIQ